MNIKLAEALLRRKELNEKVSQLRAIKDVQVYEVIATRRQITESVDDLVMKVPKLQLNQVTAEYDWYAKHLRLLDAKIQQANWTCEIEIDSKTMDNYSEK